MARFKWGGAFCAVDPGTRETVTGTIGGEFVGDYSPDQEALVKSMLLASVNDVLGKGGSIAEAVTNFPALGDRLSAAVEAPLAKIGCRGHTTVVFAKRR